MYKLITFFIFVLTIGKLYSQQQDTLLAKQYFNKGEAFKKERKIDSSRYYYEAAKMIYQLDLSDSINKVSYVRCLNNFTRLDDMSVRSDTTEINKRLSESIDLLGDRHPEIAKTYHIIGAVYNVKGDYNQALEYFMMAVDIQKDTNGKKHLDLAMSYNNIGVIYDAKGENDQALEYFLLALNIRKEAYGERHSDVAMSYNNIGMVYWNKRENDQALEYFMMAINIQKETNGERHFELASSYNNIGMVYWSKGEYELALKYYLFSLDIYKETYGERHPDVAMSYNNIGMVYDEKGDYNQALEYYLFALGIYKETLGENHPVVAMSYNNLGIVYGNQGENDHALEYFLLALDVRKEIYGDRHPFVAMSYNNIGNVYNVIGKNDQALEYYQKALIANSFSFDHTNINTNPVHLDFLSSNRLLKSLIYKSSLLIKLNNDVDLTNAFYTVQYADRVLDTLRLIKKRLADQLELGSYSSHIYELGIQSSSIDSAFYFSEKNKGGSLQLSLAQTNAIQFSGIPNSLVNLNEQIQNDLTSLSEQLRDEKIACPECDSANINKWQEKVFHLHEDKDSLQGVLNEYPEYKKLTENSFTATVSTLQQQYISQHPETAIIEYYWGDSAMYVFAITDKTYQMKTIPYAEDFNSNFYGLLRLISSSSNAYQTTKNYAEKSYWAYQTFIAPIQESINDKSHWIIIPDGDLYKLPFGALLTSIPKDNTKDYSKLGYLAKEKAISYHFSATLLMQEAERKRKKALKDFIGFAPVFEQSTTEPMVTSMNVKLASIPGTEREIMGIYELYSQVNPKKSRMFLHEAATESAFKTADLENYKTVMVSTHGFTDDERPEFSGIAFYPDTTDQEDDILYSGEMYNLNLNAKLVILAGCETGGGERKRGEGLMGLTRGLFYSGAKRVMSSLWKVSDASTAKLNLEFQKYLLEGHSYPKALQMARKVLINDPKTAHPYYWSAFVLLGE